MYLDIFLPLLSSKQVWWLKILQGGKLLFHSKNGVTDTNRQVDTGSLQLGIFSHDRYNLTNGQNEICCERLII